VLTLAQLRELAQQVGFPDPRTAAAIAMAESGGNPLAQNINPPRERSFGLWQINVLAHRQYDASLLGDPLYNAQAALALSKRGTDWSHWGAYTDGSYRQHMGDAA
jgi:Lysozyme like domain